MVSGMLETIDQNDSLSEEDVDLIFDSIMLDDIDTFCEILILPAPDAFVAAEINNGTRMQ